MRNQKGFTLIELVVVIVILGILAAVAVPKFIDMQVDARISAVNGLYGAVQSASALAHAQALVQGNTGDITMEGTNVAMVNGYPSAAAGGIRAAVNLNGFNYAVDTDGTGTFTLANGPPNCRVTYAAAATGGAPTITNLATDTNCQ